MMGQDSDSVSNLSKKLSPPLVTLLSSEPEVIRETHLVLQLLFTACPNKHWKLSDE